MDEGKFFVRYFDQRFPLGPKSLVELVAAAALGTGLSPDDPFQQELESLGASLAHLPDRRATAAPDRRQLACEKEVFKRRLQRLSSESPEVARAFDKALQKLNGTPGDAASFDALDRLLGEQSYRLASWRVASQEINYRRFFDINALVALRMEEPAVFDRAHRLLFQFLDEGLIQALRLDHTDGLYDPADYFETLQNRFRANLPVDPTRTPDDAARPLPILVEKILESYEKLPASWPVDGTTGYEFAAAAIGISVDQNAEAAFTALYREFTGDDRSFHTHVYESKQRILMDSLASEVNMLARRLERIAAGKRHWRDFTLVSLTRALIEILAAFPVYRTYLRPGAAPTEEDARVVMLAVRLARMRSAPALDASIFEFIQSILLLSSAASQDERRVHEWFTLRFQQLTGPIMAKAVEDTAFYRYHRLIALNEVGGDPATFGVSAERFHAEYAERFRSWPLSMVTTSTHDTKRGEDAAAAIAVLTELPDEWQSAVREWATLTEKYKRGRNGSLVPTRPDEYMFYQALVGAWPYAWDGERDVDAFTARLQAFMQKATKEAKQKTSWIAPDPDYDNGVAAFVKDALDDVAFRNGVRDFCTRLGPYAAMNGLSKTLLRLCSPGVPDTYQGAELWNQSLVDPDNRRRVDYARRREMLAQLEAASDRASLIEQLLHTWPDGSIKLFVVQTALQARKRMPDVFLQGEYAALPAGGHAIAFSRTHGSGSVLVCVPRLSLRLTRGQRRWPLAEVWGEQAVVVPSGSYRDAFTGRLLEAHGALRLSDCFSSFPLALLVSEGAVSEGADGVSSPR
jgi:(1->4)-alpha-D-glucan 1-alpha-D-glucosylmutase